jgi:hypothetical protein
MTYIIGLCRWRSSSVSAPPWGPPATRHSEDEKVRHRSEDVLAATGAAGATGGGLLIDDIAPLVAFESPLDKQALCTHTHTHSLILTHTYIHAHTHTHTYTHTHTHTHTHQHTHIIHTHVYQRTDVF